MEFNKIFQYKLNIIIFSSILFVPLSISNQAIFFTNEPQDTIVLEGSSALLSCDGSSPILKVVPIINWYGPDGQYIGMGDNFRTQLKNGSLYISSVEKDRYLTGKYQCSVNIEGIGTIVSRFATVSTVNTPDLNQDYIEIYLLPGQTAYFSCMLSEIPKNIVHNIIWLKNDIPLLLDELRMVILPNGALEIDKIHQSDSGTYQCNVTVGTICKLSSKTSLNTKIMQDLSQENVSPPSFLVGPSPITAKEGDTVTFNCVVNGIPKPEIRWLKNGELLDMKRLESRFSIVGTASLQISSVEDTDSGNYQCRASNTVESLDAEATLQIQIPPKFIQTPTDESAYVKEELELECNVYGKPKPLIQWIKNGVLIKSNEYMKLVEGRNLQINGLLPTDAGMFQCLATNSVGSIQSASRVQISEIINLESHNLTNNGISAIGLHNNDLLNRLPGPPQDLVAIIVKPQLITLSWIEPNENAAEIISYTVYYKNTASEREQKIVTKSSDDRKVYIPSLMPGQKYEFRVAANTNYGQSELSEILTMTTQPEDSIAGPPRNLEGYPRSATEIYVKWKQPMIINEEILKYRIYYLENINGHELYNDSSAFDVVLSDLRPFTDYTITVVSCNKNGMGELSEEIKVKTLSTIPSKPPNNVSLEVTSSTSITLHWEPLAEEDCNGLITGYKIRIRKLKEPLNVYTTAASTRLFEFNDLERRTEYQIKMCAMTVNGTGPFTEWIKVMTLENDLDETQVPGKPIWISINPAVDHISLHWAPPQLHEIKIRKYVLGWGRGIPDENTAVLKESDRHYVLKDLESNTEYVVSLRARNIKGDGPPIYDNIKTRDTAVIDVPIVLEVPVGLRAITMSSSSIVVYWIDITLNKNQHVYDNRHYTVRYNSIGSSSRYRYHNTTNLNCMVNDLKPNTLYEFSVKVVKGGKESAWSMSVLNTTYHNIPVGPPRDLIVRPDEQNYQNIILQWLPPKHSLGPITGYNIYYTNNITRRDKDWTIEAFTGEETMIMLPNLQPFTTYYFKVQARTLKSYNNGPFSSLATYTTNGMITTKDTILLGETVTDHMLYIIIGVAILIIVFVIICIRICRNKPNTSPEHTKKSYQKSTVEIPKPPDLWIHHDQMELKNIENNTTHQTQVSSSGVLTLPRSSVVHNYDEDTPTHVSNSLEKSLYGSGYITNSMTMERPQYPRTQYNISVNHSNIHVDTDLSQQSLCQVQNNSLAQTPETSHIYDATFGNAGGYATNVSVTNNSVSGNAGVSVIENTKRGNPLKSFTNSCAPLAGNSTCGNKQGPAVTIRPQNLSPYKKPSFYTGTPNRLKGDSSIAHSSDEIQRLAPSSSTEELNQEMANLEDLMKDLSAITANEFEC